MFRKFCVLTAFLLTLALPASAQIQYCSGSSCQYIRNEAFATAPSPADWTFGNNSWWQTVTDPCAWGGGTSAAANLPAGGGILQEFTTSSANYWSIRLDVYFGDPGGTTNDKINVYVLNVNTGVQEIFTVDATGYGLCASVVNFNLANNYSNATVRVTLRRGLKSTMNSIAVDNVSFWGRV